MTPDPLDRLSTAQRLAVAVLQGDLDAVAPLLDHLTELGAADGRRLVPLRTLQVGDPDRLRAVFYVNNDTDMTAGDAPRFDYLWRQWLAGQAPALLLTGIDRLEVYEVPEHVARLAEQKLRDERQALEERAQDSLTRRVQAINEYLVGRPLPAVPPEPGPIGPPTTDWTAGASPEEVRNALGLGYLVRGGGNAPDDWMPMDGRGVAETLSDQQLWDEAMRRDLVPPGAQPWRGLAANWGDPPAPSLGESNDVNVDRPGSDAVGADGYPTPDERQHDDDEPGA